jgi:DNA-binding transcriptional MerR regulator
LQKAQHINFLFLLWLAILSAACVYAEPFAITNSSASRALLERLRQKHQLQDTGDSQKRIDELVNKLKQKHEQSQTEDIPAPSEQKDWPFQDSDEPVATASEPRPETAEETAASATAADKEVILAESYETATLTENLRPDGLSSNFSQKEQRSSKKDDLSFGAFFVTLIALFLAFSVGGDLIGMSRQGGQPGTGEKAGCALLAIGFIGSIFAFARFWPILLLFAIIFILGGSRDSGDCGCGCGGCLMIIIIILLLF